MARARGGALLALACLAACSSPSGPSTAPASGPSPGTGPTSTATSAIPSIEPGDTEPLVLVTRATAPRLDLTLRQARRHVQRRDAQVDPRRVLRQVRNGDRRVGVVPASVLDATVRAARVGGIDPVRNPQDYRLQVPGEAPGPVTRLTVTGDVMLTRGVADPSAALAPMRKRLAGADLTVGNLEGTLSRAGEPQQGGDSFGADPGVVGVLERAGFDAVSVANNHTGDFGDAALVETVRRLRASAVRPFGAGRDLAEASRPVVLRHAGVSFGFLGFNAIGETPRAQPGQPGALSVRMPPRTGPLDRGDLRTVLAAVRRLDRRVDVVVVLPHWGTQYTHVAEPVQRTVGTRLVGAGADLVVGGHPHWVQGVEWRRGRLLLHSLGNFVFDMDFMVETQQGVLLEVTFWGEELKAFDLVPYRMGAGFAPRVAGPAEAEAILGDVRDHSWGPFSAD